jgi:nitrite reductase (NADH) large subunit
MRFVIVGGGVAGMTAALDLASRDVGEIDVYSDESYPYYYRPMLTEFLAGRISQDRLIRRGVDWYEKRGIHVHLDAPVTAIHPEKKAITVADEEEVSYDKLLIAIGSQPSRPPIEGVHKPGIYTWRTLDDTLELIEVARACQKTLVIGGGLLGLEAARGLQQYCDDLTVLEYFPRLLPRQLDVEGAAVLQDFVESLGVDVVVDAKTVEFPGEERATGAKLADGREFPAGLIVVTAGVRCNTDLAKNAGLKVDRGILVDDRMATSAPDIYAAGDDAVYKDHYWAIAPIAQAQARIAAANMAGEETHYDVVVPSTTLKVVGIDVASIGEVHPPEDDDAYTEIRSLDREESIYKKIVLQEDKIVGAIAINAKDLARELEPMISERRAMTPEEAQALLAK